jgi:DNA invertase Pin-like site-specific DNA recombinase
MPTAALYARISSDRDGDKLGVGRQIEDCEALAQRRGWAVGGHYIDDDVSAYSGRVRPEYRRMLDDLRAGSVDAVVVWHLDRLHRQPRELEQFFDICESVNVRALASVTGDIDLATHDGQFMARILGAVARKESDDKSRRIRRKALELAQSGKVSGGGTRPYGFNDDRKTIREDEAAVIRDCVARLLAGESLRSICSDLNTRRLPTTSGKVWQTHPLRRMLMSGRISGQRDYHGEIVADAEWPAIIQPSETARIRALFADPSRRTNRSARRYLLTRLVRCGACGESLVARPRDDGRRRYVCATGPNFTGCGKRVIVADELEVFVCEAVLYRLDSPDLAAALDGQSDTESALCQERVDEETARLTELAETWAARAITLPEWLAARSPIEARLKAAKKQLARMSRETVLGPHIGHGNALRESWPQLPLTQQRAIVAAVLDHVVVGSGRRGYNRFDPGRLEPIWRV